MTDAEMATIRHFSKAEIIQSGGNPAGLSYDLFRRADVWRDLVGWPVSIPLGGTNSGHHISNTDVHAVGEALDVYRKDGLPVNYNYAFRAALQVGFMGIGIYWNGFIYSFHFDVRNYQAWWYGVRKPGELEWRYYDIKLIDPKMFV